MKRNLAQSLVERTDTRPSKVSGLGVADMLLIKEIALWVLRGNANAVYAMAADLDLSDEALDELREKLANHMEDVK
jgi:hypothetical protein